MSLITLLVDFPNYSARRVRRLAKQLAFVEQVTEHADEPAVAKGIAADLMELNLLQAQRESQLNDDVPKEVGSDIKHALPKKGPNTWFGKTEVPANLAEAMAEIREMREDWANMAKAMGFKGFVDVEIMIERASKAAPNFPTKRVYVTPLSEAIRAIEKLENHPSEDTVASAKGIVRGASFYADQAISREVD